MCVQQAAALRSSNTDACLRRRRRLHHRAAPTTPRPTPAPVNPPLSPSTGTRARDRIVAEEKGYRLDRQAPGPSPQGFGGCQAPLPSGGRQRIGERSIQIELAMQPCEVLKERGLLPYFAPGVELEGPAFRVASSLRKKGKPVDLVEDKRLKWVFKHAERINASWLILVGKSEKTLSTREEFEVKAGEL